MLKVKYNQSTDTEKLFLNWFKGDLHQMQSLSIPPTESWSSLKTTLKDKHQQHSKCKEAAYEIFKHKLQEMCQPQSPDKIPKDELHSLFLKYQLDTTVFTSCPELLLCTVK